MADPIFTSLAAKVLGGVLIGAGAKEYKSRRHQKAMAEAIDRALTEYVGRSGQTGDEGETAKKSLAKSLSDTPFPGSGRPPGRLRKFSRKVSPLRLVRRKSKPGRKPIDNPQDQLAEWAIGAVQNLNRGELTALDKPGGEVLAALILDEIRAGESHNEPAAELWRAIEDAITRRERMSARRLVNLYLPAAAYGAVSALLVDGAVEAGAPYLSIGVGVSVTLGSLVLEEWRSSAPDSLAGDPASAASVHSDLEHGLLELARPLIGDKAVSEADCSADLFKAELVEIETRLERAKIGQEVVVREAPHCQLAEMRAIASRLRLAPWPPESLRSLDEDTYKLLRSAITTASELESDADGAVSGEEYLKVVAQLYIAADRLRLGHG